MFLLAAQSNPTYFIEDGERKKRYVLRKKPPGKLIKGAHAVDREFRVMNALGKAGFAVPRTYTLCQDPAVIGTDFYVMDFVKGQILTNDLASIEPRQRLPALKSIVTTLAKLHSYDPEQLGLLSGKPFGRVGGFYERQVATMARISEAQVSGGLGQVPEMKSFRSVVELFRSHLPEDRTTVIHGDWKPDNVIMSAPAPGSGANPEVLIVVDWELSTIGHPMSDLANLCLPYYIPSDLNGIYPVFDLSPGSGIPAETEVHRLYCEAAGIAYPIPNWHFYIAFSFFRLSVIMQGIAMRAAKGQASSAGATTDAMNMASNMFCDRALEVMSRGLEGKSAASSSRL